jgi:hypothetical protein
MVLSDDSFPQEKKKKVRKRAAKGHRPDGVFMSACLKMKKMLQDLFQWVGRIAMIKDKNNAN